MKKRYVCFSQGDAWSTLNSLWCVIRERNYVPDVVLILNSCDKIEEISDNLRELVSAHGGDAEIKITDIEDSISIDDAMDDFVIERDTIALDITGGRKETIVKILIDGYNDSFQHVFYFTSEIPIDVPYPILDHDRISLVDLMEG